MQWLSSSLLTPQLQPLPQSLWSFEKVLTQVLLVWVHLCHLHHVWNVGQLRGHQELWATPWPHISRCRLRTPPSRHWGSRPMLPCITCNKHSWSSIIDDSASWNHEKSQWPRLFTSPLWSDFQGRLKVVWWTFQLWAPQWHFASYLIGEIPT